MEFSSHRSAMQDALRSRFPPAGVIHSQEGLTDVLEKVGRAIEEPGFNPAVPVELRGTAYKIEVWSMLRTIPVGETTNDGALAARLGTRHALIDLDDSRGVGEMRPNLETSWFERERSN